MPAVISPFSIAGEPQLKKIQISIISSARSGV